MSDPLYTNSLLRLPPELVRVAAPCTVCGLVIQMGPVYQGRYIQERDAIVCHSCWHADRNGWRSEHEASLCHAAADPPTDGTPRDH
jgi:hypothetical protein